MAEGKEKGGRPNDDLRALLVEKKIPQGKVAEKMGIHQRQLSGLMQRPLDECRRKQFMEAVDALAKERPQGWAKNMKAGKAFAKGHPGYYAGKKLDPEKFMEGYRLYFVERKITQAEFAKIIGVSIPTLLRRMKELYLTGRIDGAHFADGMAVSLDFSGMAQADADAWRASLGLDGAGGQEG